MPSPLDDQLSTLHRQLNRSDIVPRHCYRRNKVHYELVCYINNIIGLLASDNLEVVPIFAGRALQHMNDIPANEESSKYYELANSYLRLIAKLLSERDIPLDDVALPSLIASLNGVPNSN